MRRKYAMHARELNNPSPEAVFFVKTPNSFFAADGSSTNLLPTGEDIHREVELVLSLDRRPGRLVLK